jgi:hypothetical protein
MAYFIASTRNNVCCQKEENEMSVGYKHIAYMAVVCWMLSCCHEKENRMPDGSEKALLEKLTLQLEQADAEIAAQNWEAANKLLLQALDELGYRYLRSDIDDNSDMKLIEADIFEEAGRLDDAVRARRGILAERLEMFRGKIQ